MHKQTPHCNYFTVPIQDNR